MATQEQREELRRLTGEVGSNTYADATLDTYISDAGDDLNVAAARIWGEKASRYADLVNISEAGSSRSNSDLFKHAREMQLHFQDVGGEVVEGGYTRIGKIVRQ